MPTKQKAYKVVRVFEGRRVSANGHLKEMPAIQLEYFDNERAKPKKRGAKLFVFANLSAARTFRDSLYWEDDKFEIWECDAFNCQQAPERLVRLQDSQESHTDNAALIWLQNFWKGKTAWFNEISLFRTPAESLVCSSLILRKKIE